VLNKSVTNYENWNLDITALNSATALPLECLSDFLPAGQNSYNMA